jgi:hypothetical protein
MGQPQKYDRELLNQQPQQHTISLRCFAGQAQRDDTVLEKNKARFPR